MEKSKIDRFTRTAAATTIAFAFEPVLKKGFDYISPFNKLIDQSTANDIEKINRILNTKFVNGPLGPRIIFAGIIGIIAFNWENILRYLEKRSA